MFLFQKLMNYRQKNVVRVIERVIHMISKSLFYEKINFPSQQVALHGGIVLIANFNG